MKYEFHVNDTVETKNDVKGYITRIRNVDDSHYQIVTICMENNWFYSFGIPLGEFDGYDDMANIFKRIGRYNFIKPEPKSIERLPVDLVARFEVPDGRYIATKTWDKDGKFVEASYSRELIDKINELINVVNELQEDYNTHLEAHKQNER